MSSRERKREIEGLAFKRFAALMELDVREWRYGADGDEPDIVARISDRHVGLEVTGLTSEDVMRTRAKNGRVSDCIMEACSMLDLPPLQVNVHGLNADFLTRNDCIALVQRLASFVSTLAPFERCTR